MSLSIAYFFTSFLSLINYIIFVLLLSSLLIGGCVHFLIRQASLRLLLRLKPLKCHWVMEKYTQERERREKDLKHSYSHVLKLGGTSVYSILTH